MLAQSHRKHGTQNAVISWRAYKESSLLKNSRLNTPPVDGQWRMHHNRPAILPFAILGGVSGILSGNFSQLPVIGWILPGLFFGIAISDAIQKFSISLSIRQQFQLITICCLGHLAAIFVSIFSFRLIGNEATAFHGAVAGLAGGLFIGFALTYAIRDRAATLRMTIIPAAGALLGALFTLLTVFLNDHA